MSLGIDVRTNVGFLVGCSGERTRSITITQRSLLVGSI